MVKYILLCMARHGGGSSGGENGWTEEEGRYGLYTCFFIIIIASDLIGELSLYATAAGAGCRLATCDASHSVAAKLDNTVARRLG